MPDFTYSKIHFGAPAYDKLNSLLNSKESLFILADENTLKYCYPYLADKTPAIKNAEIIEIPEGEDSKDIEICNGIWKTLLELHANRESLLINLGGGVVTDIGGFIASTYKRGINFINIPTSLMAMVDAAIGGKNGINAGKVKNITGTFSFPSNIFIFKEFLTTLPENHFRSAFSEMLKHALIADNDYWIRLSRIKISKEINWLPLIRQSIEIKNTIINKDPYEKDIRKVLNFGHTIGHAIETLSLENKKSSLLHGEAIAAGIICESYISHILTGLKEELLEDICSVIKEFFFLSQLNFDSTKLSELILHDKKNSKNNINFTLLSGIGETFINRSVSSNIITDSLKYYNKIARNSLLRKN